MDKFIKLAVENPFTVESKIKHEHPSLYKEISEIGDNQSFKEKLWCYVHNDKTIKTCSVCSGELDFENISSGYTNNKCPECYVSEIKKPKSLGPRPDCAHPDCDKPVRKRHNRWLMHCSDSCKNSHNSIKSRDKAMDTYFRKTGYQYALKNPEVMNKMRDNNYKKYGYYNVSAIPESIEKRLATSLEKYGYKSSFGDPIKRQAMVDSVATELGYKEGEFEYISQIPDIHSRKLETGYNSKKYVLPSGKSIIVQGYENIFWDKVLQVYGESFFDYGNLYIPYSYEERNRAYIPDGFFLPNDTIIEVKSDYTLLKDIDKNIAKIRGVIDCGKSITIAVIKENTEIDFLSFDKNILDIIDTMKKYTTVDILPFIGNNVVSVSFPDLKLALYVSDSSFVVRDIVDSSYLNRIKKEVESEGFKFIYVHSIDLHKKAWRNTLLAKLGLIKKSIYARNCTIQEVKAGSDNFLNEHHIQGKVSTSIKYGLYHKNTLVGMMCFSPSKNRKGVGKNRGDGAYELVRYVTSVNIPGGASKLLSHFEKNHSPLIVYSYSDNDISDGKLYKVLGFELENETTSDYCYYKPGDIKLTHRFSLSRKKQASLFSDFDDTLSGNDNAKKQGYVRPHKLGKKTWVKHYGNK